MKRIGGVVGCWALLSTPGMACATVLATPSVPTNNGGRIWCSAVNVGDEGSREITVTLVDASTGEVTEEEECTADRAVGPGKRCRVEDIQDPLPVSWCRVEVKR